jgi:ribonuclease HI
MIGIVLVSQRSATFYFYSWLKTQCTNNQAEYEAHVWLRTFELHGIDTHVKIFDDSQLVVQQILGENRCLDGVGDLPLPKVLKNITKHMFSV